MSSVSPTYRNKDSSVTNAIQLAITKVHRTYCGSRINKSVQITDAKGPYILHELKIAKLQYSNTLRVCLLEHCSSLARHGSPSLPCQLRC